MKRRGAIAGAIVATALGCSAAPPLPPPPPAPEAGRALTVVGISDYHGALAEGVYQTRTGAKVPVGGAAWMAAYVDAIRRTAPGPVLVLDAGDMFQGTLASNLAEGAPVIRLYNEMGLHAAAVGNHEFDFGPVGPSPIALEEGQNPRGALEARISEARFAFLGANIVDESGKVPSPFRASVVLDLDGVKVGVIGLSTTKTPTTTVRRNLVGLQFRPLGPVASAEAGRLREAGVDFVVITMHDGGGCQDNRDPDDLSSCWGGAIFALAKSLPNGLVDLILGGHTHQGIAKRVNGIVVLQGFARGQYLSWASLPLDRSPATIHPPLRLCGATVETDQGPSCEKNAVRASESTPRPALFAGTVVTPDADILAMVERDLDRVVEVKNRPLGVEAAQAITRSYDRESPLGSLVADVFRREVPEADVGMTNGGGLRADLPAGSLTYGHLFEALPFDNHLALLKVDGSTLGRMVALGLTGGHGALLWSGLEFEADACRVENITVKGEPLEAAARYTVVTSDYLAGGGSGFDTLGIEPDSIEVLWERAYLRDIVAKHLPELGETIAPGDFMDPSAPRQRLTGSCKLTPTGAN